MNVSSQADLVIHARGLRKDYRKGQHTITPLSGLDLDVGRGEFLSLMGPSGSGKTTLLNLISAIDTPSGGELQINGTDIGKLPRGKLAAWRSRNVGYIFQLYHLVPVLTAYENVELPLLLHRMSRRQRHEKVMAALEMATIADRHNHYPRQLSGGQEQRVAIARAIITDAPLLVADEPTGDLDKESAAHIMGLLRSLVADHQRTVVMVTHDPKAAEQADRCLHLEKGQLLEQVPVTPSTDSRVEA